jgi:adenosylhomocysteine nucleosidase
MERFAYISDGATALKTVGLIAAMQQEIRPLLSRVGKWEPVRVDGFPGYRFRVAGLDCLLIRSGVGQRNAAEAANALVAATKPGLLLSFGIAGAVGAGLRIGDVVVGTSVCLLKAGSPGKILPLAALATATQMALADALGPRHSAVVSGTILTTSGTQPIPGKIKGLPHPVVEMETFGIAEVAATLGVPLLSLRSISDNPEAPIPFPVEETYDAEYRLRTGRMILKILGRPALLPQLAHLVRNSDRAAENAALAVMAVLVRVFSDSR